MRRHALLNPMSMEAADKSINCKPLDAAVAVAAAVDRRPENDPIRSFASRHTPTVFSRFFHI